MHKYLKNTDTEWYKQRVVSVVCIVIAAFAVLGLRLFYLQVLEGEKYRSSSDNQKIRKHSIEPQRGVIFDRNGLPLVNNRPSFNLSITLKDAKPVKNTIKKLSDYLNLAYDNIINIIESNKDLAYNPIILKKDIGRKMLAVVETHKFDLPGVAIDVQSRRNYIFGDCGAHFLGYLGEINNTELHSGDYPDCRPGDHVGKIGIEKEYDRFLRGERGGRLVEVNVKGQIMRNLQVVEAQPGDNVFLTIDHRTQARGMELMSGLSGAAVVIDALNGHILAMVSTPSFNPNSFIGGISNREWNELLLNPNRPMENKAIRGQYPPASTYKIVTAIAGLEEGVIDKDTTFYCPGFLRYGDRAFRCWKRTGHGSVDLKAALAESCDVFFYHVGMRIGVDKLADYAKICGLGSPTGIRMGREESGVIPTERWKRLRFGTPWHKGETLPVAIGQGYNLTTPIQMAVLVATVANGGRMFEPVILKKIETASHKIRPLPDDLKQKEIRKFPFKKENLEIVKSGLWEVINGPSGTARRARIEGLDVYGKTGTAQVVGRKTGEKDSDKELPDHFKPHAWFVAWAENEGKKIACSVIVEHGESGSGSAAPIARELLKCYLKR